MPHQDIDAMQQARFEQFDRTMMTMLERFAAAGLEISTSLREELEAVHRFCIEIESRRIESLRGEPELLAVAETLARDRARRWQNILELWTTRH